jgi:hypothetical protein
MSVLDDLLPTAKDLRVKIAEIESAKADEYMRAQSAKEAEKKALMEQFAQPSGISVEEGMKRAAAIINRAVSNGLTEVEVVRFPNELCTDKGRAINQGEAGWESTLTGRPRELYEFWSKHLQPRGYKLRCQIVDWPDGRPGNVGITLAW